MAVLQGISKVQHRDRDQSVCVSVCERECVGGGAGMDGRVDGQGKRQAIHTSSYPQHSHDADDGGVNRQRSLFNLLQSDAHDGEQHDY